MAKSGSSTDDKGTAKTAARKVPLPSPDAGTNLLIADIVVRGASTLFRNAVEKRVAKASVDEDSDAQDLLDGRAVITTLGLYGASKLATRSVPGLLMVSGGLLAKTLYDRGKARQRRLAKEASPPAGSPNDAE
ncbi:hypothetical protein [Erythrobacter sp. Alg231-14]|uniref:hypothetical protein n=1 Tax=Erythrobacter sp. Alg231-14 TaxID=1922225 RepID=UPI000D55BF8F